MTTDEAAAFLEVSRGRVHHFISEGRLKAEKIGRDWHIKERDAATFKKTLRPVGRPAKPAVKKRGVKAGSGSGSGSGQLSQ
jgi:excisionase family DNA binding protein